MLVAVPYRPHAIRDHQLLHALAPVGHAASSFATGRISSSSAAPAASLCTAKNVCRCSCIHSCCHVLQMLLAEGWTYLPWIASSTMMCPQTPKTTSTELAEQLGLAGGLALVLLPIASVYALLEQLNKGQCSKILQCM